MPQNIPGNIVQTVRNRQTLLWVCQRYDLTPDENPHEYDLPETDALLRYRPNFDKTDTYIAEMYWETIWIEGAKSPLIPALRQTANKTINDTKRSVITLSSEADAGAAFSSKEFLPVYIFPGVIDNLAPNTARYGYLKKRARERLAWSFASRLISKPGRVLVVIGAHQENDLEYLYEVLEDNLITNLHIILLWPESKPLPNLPQNAFLNFIFWQGSCESFLQLLKQKGAPLSWDLAKWAIRVGNKTVPFSGHDVDRILDRFVLIAEKDLIPPDKFEYEDLLDFLNGNINNWSSFATGLPVKREYKTDLDLSLKEEIDYGLKCISEDKTIIFKVTLPCEGGAGTTTIMRKVAFELASKGHPTLLLRPSQVDVNLEDLTAFAVTLTEMSLLHKVDMLPPMVLVFDVEHSIITQLRQIPAVMAAEGRRCLILQAISEDKKFIEIKRTNSTATLPSFTGELKELEVENCAKSFDKNVRKWNLPIELPSVENWKAYEKATRWITPNGLSRPKSTFWIALKFFLTDGLDFIASEETKDALGNWIEKRAKRIKNHKMVTLVDYIACLSAFRIISPLWTVLRSVTGQSFTSEIVDLMKEIEDIVIWSNWNEDLKDQSLHFIHPEFALEYLRRKDIKDQKQIAEKLRPLLVELSAGHPGDIWVAESLVTNILTPSDQEHTYDWDWRLQCFDYFPPIISNQSKVILHHWARCLYHSVTLVPNETLPISEKKIRFEKAIGKLNIATNIPRRNRRDEHPSHLYNTMGTAYWRYSRFLLELNEPQSDITDLYDKSFEAFNKSIELSDGQNVEAFLALSLRLIERAKSSLSVRTEDIKQNVEDLAYCLTLLDEAEDLIQIVSTPDPSWTFVLHDYRTQALACLNTHEAKEYVHTLIESVDPELGYYCLARLEIQDLDCTEAVIRALKIFTDAIESGVKLKWRSLLFLIYLYSKHPKDKYDFFLIQRLYQELENDPNYKPRPIDYFRHAVLYYQCGDYFEGKERFKRLRTINRRSNNAPLMVKDWWRDLQNPFQIRTTSIRIDRVVSIWRAIGYIEDLKQNVPLRPRHFKTIPKEGDFVSCIVRFGMNGPFAVPERFRPEIDSNEIK